MQAQAYHGPRAAFRHSSMAAFQSSTDWPAAGPGICSPGFHLIPPGGGGGGAGKKTEVTMPLNHREAGGDETT